MQASFNRIHMTEERISEGTIENTDTRVEENAKVKNFINQNIQEIQNTTRKANLKINGTETSEDSKIKGPVNIFNEIVENKQTNKQTKLP